MTGFALGNMVGVATGLLVAPTNGKQAWKKIYRLDDGSFFNL